jgi:hypothetical protein
MFAHDLCHRQVEDLSISIDFNGKDRANDTTPPPADQSSIINIQFPLARVRL